MTPRNLTPDEINRFIGIYEKSSDLSDNGLDTFILEGNINDVMNYIMFISNMIEKKESQIKAIDFSVSTFSLMDIGFDCDDVDDAKNALTVSMEDYRNHMKGVYDLLNLRRTRCNHQWVDEWGTSHQRCKRCTLCGKEDWF